MNKVVSDQADGLRFLMAQHAGACTAKVVALVGSSPGVGASSVALNLAAALKQQGQEVLLMDEHEGEQLPVEIRASFRGQVILIDASQDESGALSPLAAQADQIVVVLRPQAASITAAYACIKQLHFVHAVQQLRIMINLAADMPQAQRALSNLAETGSRYLGVALEPAGCVTADPHLTRAHELKSSVVETFQASAAAVDFRRIAAQLLQWPRQLAVAAQAR